LGEPRRGRYPASLTSTRDAQALGGWHSPDDRTVTKLDACWVIRFAGS
jgi:hypothetical protein